MTSAAPQTKADAAGDRAGAGAVRLLLLVPSLTRAGAESQLVSLANALAGRGFEVHLATFGDDLALLERLDRGRVRFHRLRRRGRLDPGLPVALARLVRRHHIDVVHCTLQISLFYAALARLLLRRGPPLVVALHTTLNRSAREERYDRWLYRWMIGRCARVVFVCEAQAAYWLSRYRGLAGRDVVIYNGVEPSRFDPSAFHAAGQALREELRVGPGELLFVCVARLRPEKGHLLLLEAFARALAQCGDLHLALAGDGEMRAAVEAARERAGLGGRVHLLGDVPDPRPLYAAADATVLASTSVETFSMAMLESLAMGTPMIASDIGGMAEAIEDDITGLLVPPGDVAALSAALCALAADRARLDRLGAAGRARVEARFTVEAMASSTAAMLQSVVALADRRRGRA